MQRFILGILAGWSLFFVAFVVAFVLMVSCSPLFAQYDLQNVDIDPVEVLDIEPEEPEPEEPPYFPEDFPDFWEDEDEVFFPFFSVSCVNPVLAQIDPVEIEDPIEPENPDDPEIPDDLGLVLLPPDSVDWGELVLEALANLYPSGNYQLLTGRGGRTLAAGIDSNGDLRVVEPENLNNQAVFDPDTGVVKQYELGSTAFITDDPAANIYDSCPGLVDWTVSEVQNSGGNGENQQQESEQQPAVPNEFQQFSLLPIVMSSVAMLVPGVALFLGLYAGLWGLGLVWKKFKAVNSAGAGDYSALEEKLLDDYIAESKRILGEE